MRNTSEIGKLGEDLACRFLMKQGFKVVERNFRKPYGEIDLVALKAGIIHFVEVKSVSHETSNIDVSHETDLPMPEENITPLKMRRLEKAALVFLEERGREEDWQIDSLAVFIDASSRKALFRFMENISV